MEFTIPQQLQDLHERNAELVRQLQLKDAQIQDLQDTVAAATELQSQEPQAAKIIELSKKNRTLNLAIEKEKQKVAKLMQDVRELQQGNQLKSPAVAPEALEEVARNVVEQAAEAAAAAQKEALGYKERMQQQTTKMAQLEQRAFALEIDNKKLHRALAREVGEEVPLSKILDESSDWKGRREQIIALRDQVKQLKAAQGLVVDSKAEASNKKAITKLSKDRSNEADRISAELTATRQELDTMKMKYEGAVSRKKILEGEISNLKDKVAIILEKTNNDDRLISALKNEVATLKRQVATMSASAPKSDDQLWQEISQLRRRLAEQEEQIDRQEQIILALQHQGATSGSATTPRGGAKDSGLEQQLKLAEIENSRLQQLVVVLQTKLSNLHAA